MSRTLAGVRLGEVAVIKRARARAGAAGAAAIVALLASCSDSGGGETNEAAQTRASTPAAAGSAAGGNGLGSPGGSDGAAVKDYWSGRADLSVFLCNRGDKREGGCAAGAVTDAQREAIRSALTSTPGVASVAYESNVEAFQRFRESNKGSALANAVTADQLPESFRVDLTDPAQYAAVEAILKDTPGVQSVRRIS